MNARVVLLPHLLLPRSAATLRPVNRAFGGCQAVMRDRTNHAWIAARESRKDGMAAGY